MEVHFIFIHCQWLVTDICMFWGFQALSVWLFCHHQIVVYILSLKLPFWFQLLSSHSIQHDLESSFITSAHSIVGGLVESPPQLCGNLGKFISLKCSHSQSKCLLLWKKRGPDWRKQLADSASIVFSCDFPSFA